MAHKIELYGVIGIDFWDLGVSAKTLIAELKRIAADEMDQDVQIHINSGGGYVDDAVAMYNRLRRHARENDATITVVIDALAASAATIVAMAGDRIEMPDNASMMIHQPWGFAQGTAEEMRDYADLLDRTEDSMVRMYLRQATDLDEGELRAMLESETWLNAEEALALGLIDEVADSAEDAELSKASAAMAYIEATTQDERLPTYTRPPTWARSLAPSRREPARMRASVEDPPMPNKTKTPVPAALPAAPVAVAPPVAAVARPVDDSAHKQAIADAEKAAATKAKAAERARVKAIQALCERHGATDELQASLIDGEVSVDKAKGMILDAQADAQPSIGSIRNEKDEADKRVDGVQKSIELRAGLLTPAEAREERAQNPYASQRLDNLALMFADRKIGARMQILGEVLSAGRPRNDMAITHTASDFTNILSNVAHKSMLMGWDQIPETFEPWTNRGILTDFKATSRVGLNHHPALEELGDGGEYKGVTVGDRGEAIQLVSYGNLFGITRQSLINDDLSAFTRVPQRMGAAAKRTVGNLVYAVLTANGLMADGVALFDLAGHGNLQASDIDAAGLAVMKTAMRTQANAGATLSIEPRYMIVPAALELAAQQLLNTILTSDGTTTITNVQQGDVEIIVEPRLDANSAVLWYLAASGAVTDTVEVSYLDGNDQPFLDQQEGWGVDGTEFKVRIDVGVAALDHRGLQRGDNTP